MNPSTAFGITFTDELVRCGLREVVLAPGLAQHAAGHGASARPSSSGRVRLHVRIDERSASFTALGLAKASRRPVAVVCTSGTAAANFHPAVIEADESAVPLLVLTADRPPELRGTGANQAIDQIKLYGGAVRWFCEAGVPEARPGMAGYWRSLACQAWAHAAGRAGGLAGPVHLNLAFREPLVPGEAGGRTGRSPWTGARTDSRGRVSSCASAPRASSSCRGPNAAWWSAETATTTRRPWSSWPNGRAGRCSPSPRPAPAAGRTRCPPTSTCSRRRSSSRRTGPA